MRGEDPFAGLERDLSYWDLPEETVEIALEGHSLPEEEQQLRFLAYAGLFDLLVEALAESCETDQERDRELAGILGKFRSVQPTLRFWLFEKSQEAEGLELVSRMRGKDIAVTEEWMVPRLAHDMAIYGERIAALRAALSEASG